MRKDYLPRDDKDFAGCSISGIMNIKGEKFTGEMIIQSIANMRCRSNGLGGGFAGYGIYPEHENHYCFHLMYMNSDLRYEVEEFLKKNFNVVEAERIPTRKVPTITDPPLLFRYFLDTTGYIPEDVSEHDYVVDKVMTINTCFDGACVASSGKNMGVFKGVGFPEDIGDFYCLEEYKGYLWIAHGRFPTNTPGWWGGAHPFNILNWSVVHNGEISSYGTNVRYLEMFGYKCALLTDTEVVAYTMDLLMRRHKLPVELAAAVIAPPLWSEIEHMNEEEKKVFTSLRQVYGSLLLNGPFAFIIANENEMIGITDRIRLRPLVAGKKGDFYFMASEEAGIREVSPELEEVWAPRGGEPIVARLIQKEPLETVVQEEAI